MRLIPRRVDFFEMLEELAGTARRGASMLLDCFENATTPEQVREIAGYADGIIVGSAIVSRIGELGDAPDMPRTIGAFVKTLADAAKSVK